MKSHNGSVSNRTASCRNNYRARSPVNHNPLGSGFAHGNTQKEPHTYNHTHKPSSGRQHTRMQCIHSAAEGEKEYMTITPQHHPPSHIVHPAIERFSCAYARAFCAYISHKVHGKTNARSHNGIIRRDTALVNAIPRFIRK